MPKGRSLDSKNDHSAFTKCNEMSSVPSIVTTSWDDGDPADIKVAELLRSRGLCGTFYVPLKGYRGRPTILPPELRSLASEGFEVGGHGVSHRTLSTLSPESIKREVRDSKKALEDMLGAEIEMFCYPRGKYNRQVVENVRTAGYLGARTTRMLGIERDFEIYKMPTSLQAYPHRQGTYIKNIAKSRNVGRLINYAARFRRAGDWIQLGKELFDHVVKHGGVWHLYGHSWEIEELNLWSGLKEVLDHVCRRNDVLYLSNGETLQDCRSRSRRRILTTNTQRETQDSTRP